MKKNIIICLSLSLLAILLFSQPIYSQKYETKSMTFDKGEVTIIQGLGAIVKSADNALKIEMIPPKNQRSKEYREVDLKANDIIKMVNGKKVETIAEFDSIIENLEIGDEISLGIKRDRDMMIVSFVKADPGAGGQMMVMTQTVDESGEMKTSMNIAGENMDDVIYMTAGLILKDSDEGLSVASVMPQFNEIIEGALPEVGDLVIGFNGKKDADFETVQEEYNSLKEGETVTLLLKNASGEFSISFTKKAIPMENIKKAE